MSVVHALPSSQDVGQGWSLLVGSQVSPLSSSPSPHFGEQSLSISFVQSFGQQPSPPVHIVMELITHCASHLAAEPLRVASTQALGPEHWVGQLPSQTSPGST